MRGRARTLDPGDETAAFLHAVVAGRTVAHPPEMFVTQFFDRFAADFDRHLVPSLSERMLEKARARGLYDELVRDELGRYLDRCEAASFDLLIAADVFIYVGRLEATLAACARTLAPGGALAFSTEHLDEDLGEFRLEATARYSHAPGAIAVQAKNAGLAVASRTGLVLRTEERTPVTGHILVLEKPAAP